MSDMNKSDSFSSRRHNKRNLEDESCPKWCAKDTVSSTTSILSAVGFGMAYKTADDAKDDARDAKTTAQNAVNVAQGAVNMVNGLDSRIGLLGVNENGKIVPKGIVAANDKAALGYDAANGLELTGKGTAHDVTILNSRHQEVLSVPQGTQNVEFENDVNIGGDLEVSDGNADATGAVLSLSNGRGGGNGADADKAGDIVFKGQDGAGNATEFGKIAVTAEAVADASEQGKMSLSVATTGTGAMAEVVAITGGANAAGSTAEFQGIVEIDQGKLQIGTTAVTATAAELNMLDEGNTVQAAATTARKWTGLSRWVRGTFDATNTEANRTVAVHDIPNLVLPENSVIVGGKVVATAKVTSGGAATISLGSTQALLGGTANVQLLAATGKADLDANDVLDLSSIAFGAGKGPTQIKAEVKAAALTAGILDVFIEYIVVA